MMSRYSASAWEDESRPVDWSQPKDWAWENTNNNEEDDWGTPAVPSDDSNSWKPHQWGDEWKLGSPSRPIVLEDDWQADQEEKLRDDDVLQGQKRANTSKPSQAIQRVPSTDSQSSGKNKRRGIMRFFVSGGSRSEKSSQRLGLTLLQQGRRKGKQYGDELSNDGGTTSIQSRGPVSSVKLNDRRPSPVPRAPSPIVMEPTRDLSAQRRRRVSAPPKPDVPRKPLRPPPTDTRRSSDGFEALAPKPSIDDTTVSEVTNPTIFAKDKGGKKALDPFDVNSPVFSTGDPFAKTSTTPKQQPVLSDDFSDPFENENVADPQLDHVGMSDDDEEEKKIDEVATRTSPVPLTAVVPTSSKAVTPKATRISERVRQGHYNTAPVEPKAEPKPEIRASSPGLSDSRRRMDRYRARGRSSPSPVRAVPSPPPPPPPKETKKEPVQRNPRMTPPPPPPPRTTTRIAAAPVPTPPMVKRAYDKKQARSPSPSLDEVVIPPIGANDSFSSMGSDIRRLRAIMRRSRARQDSGYEQHIVPVESAFAVYDEREIKDPMQRAGLRLLSAAVIPIQTAARRHLALRHALARMWAIVVIQSWYRSAIKQVEFERKRCAAVLIQSVYRGGLVRDEVLLQQCCAIEIQRVVRGYLATLSVYEDLYNITMVQSLVRRKLAINRATDRMVFAIQLQSLVRGFLVRKHLKKLNDAAVVIQTAGRRFSCQFNYQLDLLDIISVQSVWRRRQAMKEGELLRQIPAATLIQANWRSYYCRVSYELDVFDIVMAQSVWRMKMGKKVAAIRQNEKRNEAATLIQAQWRAYDATMNYLTYLATVREEERCNRAATMIQAHWRSYDCTMNYLNYMADVLIVQAAVRSWLSSREYYRRRQMEHEAARTIQRVWRGFVSYADFMFTIADIVLVQAQARRLIATREANARRSVARQRALENDSALIIQTTYREYVDYRNALEYESAVLIQAAYRGYVANRDFVIDLGSALIAQSAIRMFLAKRRVRSGQVVYDILTRANGQAAFESEKALAIQTMVRGWQSRSAFKLQTSAIKVQTVFRSVVAMKELQRRLAARKIQSAWRGYVVHYVYKLFISARKIQTAWRCQTVRSAYLMYIAARRIQNVWRWKSVSRTYKQYRAAVTIQKIVRGRQMSTCYREYQGAVAIQKTVRCFLQWKCYREYRGAVTIQKHVRCYQQKRSFDEYIHHLRTTGAAILIQSVVRMKLQRMLFVDIREVEMADTIKAAVVVQKLWRGYFVREVRGIKLTQWLERLAVETIAAEEIQRTWRGYCSLRNYWQALGSVIQIQACLRTFSAKIQAQKRMRQVITIQSGIRGFKGRQEAKQRRLIMMLVKSARSGDSGTPKSVRSTRARKAPTQDLSEWENVVMMQRRVDKAARKIQAFFLMVKAEVDREIRHEKKRRKARKKSRRRRDDMDNDMLEGVWRNTVDDQSISDETLRRAEEAAAREIRGSRKALGRSRSRSKSSRASSRARSGSRGRSRETKLPDTPTRRSRLGFDAPPRSDGRLKSRIPAEYNKNKARALKSTSRRHPDLVDADEVSLMTSASSQMRMPPSRLALSRREIDEDFELETAWIDAEIRHAKERRKNR